MKTILLAWVLSIPALASDDVRGFWVCQTGNFQGEAMYYDGGSMDSGTYEERIKMSGSNNQPAYFSMLGKWKFSGDTVAYKATAYIERDSATWAVLDNTYDTAWTKIAIDMGVDGQSGDTVMSMVWDGRSLTYRFSGDSPRFTLPNAFPASALASRIAPRSGTARSLPRVLQGRARLLASGRSIRPR